MKASNSIQIASLCMQDLPDLQPLEETTRLSFWGTENYRRFLEQPEYFSRKAVAAVSPETVRMVGFFLARAVLEDLELLKICVYPGYQKQGIGTRLLDAAFNEGSRRGCLRCILEVRKSNDSAIQFYLNHRFHIAGERRSYYAEPVEDAWTMERWI